VLTDPVKLTRTVLTFARSLTPQRRVASGAFRADVVIRVPAQCPRWSGGSGEMNAR